MKRILSWFLGGVLLASALVFTVSVSATPARGPMQGDLVSAWSATSITVNTADRPVSRGVWIGVTQDLDFSFDGSTWVAFKGCTAGAVLPFQVVGVRVTSGSAAPAAGDVVFLY